MEVEVSMGYPAVELELEAKVELGGRKALSQLSLATPASESPDLSPPRNTRSFPPLLELLFSLDLSNSLKLEYEE